MFPWCKKFNFQRTLRNNIFVLSNCTLKMLGCFGGWIIVFIHAWMFYLCVCVHFKECVWREMYYCCIHFSVNPAVLVRTAKEQSPQSTLVSEGGGRIVPPLDCTAKHMKETSTTCLCLPKSFFLFSHRLFPTLCPFLLSSSHPLSLSLEWMSERSQCWRCIMTVSFKNTKALHVS